MRGKQDRPVDQAGLRKANLALILDLLRTRGRQSRAQLAGLSNLSKATVSNLVAELEIRDLVRPAGIVAGRQGRPGMLVEVQPRTVCGIGLEVNVDYLAATAIDLTGEVIHESRVPLDVIALGPERCLDELAKLATDVLSTVEKQGAWTAGITIAVPGLIDPVTGVVQLAPNLRWRQVPMADGLAGRIGYSLAGIVVDNDANLAALAEQTTGSVVGVTDLLYITGAAGIGGGIIADGVPLRGAFGSAGEVGHIAMDPGGLYCPCGSRGCWETQVGLIALLRAVSTHEDPVRDPSLDLEQRLTIIRTRAERGDRRTLDALQQIGSALGIGLSILVNVLNPAVVVLGGYFATLQEWLIEPARREVAARVLGPEAAGARLVPSQLGFSAGSRGGAHAAMRRVLDDPTLAPVQKAEATEAPA
ncbi:ROK family transcriptional regulator [Actinoalloteichus hymeniacidonis]|uniref:Transcriptional regulator/sugar kinase n=1 Tax=Actinoalloteichus hymeniacidonis TaxID=340345 RepID=A0AAC9HUE4_9PSEU|nr:ROK family protein [Actinoalloteichus hymeniacidonis]AOS65560.1 transcriptional regulator/sugar kinase [Actinoalloteichus hymeniacidonis]MBB5906350.1 putative NBD/HSP70 family sugar kinase [Actinoalloteichus hymeniacidonis]